MTTLTDILNVVETSNTRTESLISLVAGLRSQVAAIPNLTLEQQGQIEAVFAAVTAESDRVQAALDANVAPVDPAV